MVVVPGEQHVDAGLLDRVEREFLAADRALGLARDLEREQGMVRDEDAHRLARRPRERVADEAYLVGVDPAVLERQ